MGTLQIALRLSVGAAAFWLAGTESGIAQSALPSACAILANRVTPDVSSQVTSDERFAVFQQIISQETFRNFDSAKSSTLDLGISVVSYVDAFLGTTSDSATWEQNWSRFRNSTFAQGSSAFLQTTVDRHWNVDVVKAILGGCPGKPFFGVLTEVTAEQDAFTILLHGVGPWSLEQISIKPSDEKFECDGAERVSAREPMEARDEIFLTCSKDKDKSALITIRSSQGSAGPFTVKSLLGAAKDDVAGLRATVSTLQASLDALQNQAAWLTEALDSQTAAHRRALDGLRTYTGGNPTSGRMGNRSMCPDGEYAIGINGTGVPVGEGGAIGSHQVICRPLNIVR
ncbi:hypothetical protein [Sinorhizobium glycinis]|nr:hypothetical protein [Sinorhizobium glycinis]